MNKIKNAIVIGFIGFLSILPLFSVAYAKLGVGVTTGKIQIEERLMAGEIYQLPVFTVINTGDEFSDYEVSVSFRQNQDEMRPSIDWFTFTPSTFSLEPGESQTVDIELNVPINTIPGDYFCFVEGHPVVDTEGNETQIGISAASKLYFTLAPSSILQGIYYRLISLWTKYLPWTNIGAAVVVSILVILFLRKFVKIEVRLNKANKKTNDNDKKHEK